MVCVLAATPVFAAGLKNSFTLTTPQDAGQIMRGAAPDGAERELLSQRVTDVLIFKNQTKNEVDAEIATLQQLGYPKNRITHLPMKWKGITDFEESCRLTVSALKVIKNIYLTPARKLYFHCTVGEDRTGYLAGLYRVLADQWTAKESFKTEMCARGYEAGNPHKPDHVVQDVKKAITPLFSRMMLLIDSGKISWSNLDPEACKLLKKPSALGTGALTQRHNPANYNCR